MRRILKVAAFIMSAAFIMLVFACPQKAEPKPTGPVAVTGVSLNTESLTLPVGSTATLTATVAPSNATEKGVTWASNNETVATVVNGTVTAQALGTATITVTTLDGSKTATCSVTVTNHPLTSISVSPTQTSYAVGDNFDKSHITVTANYSDGSSQEVTEYTVDVTSFDTVGTTTVTVSYTENDITKTTNYDVTVNPKPIPVESVSLDQTTLSLTLDGTTATLVATISPSDATNKAVTWESSTPSVATVADGTVTAVAVGTATITVKTDDGEKTATCNVTVTNPLTSISVSPKKTVYTIGDSFDKSHITVTAHYSDGSSQEVTDYTTSPTTFNTIGTTTVTVSYTEDGIRETASYKVTVEPLKVTGVSLNQTSLDLTLDGTTATLIATVSPSDATNKAVTWESSNPSVATVADGTVTAHAVGTATITVKTEDGEKTATCDVTVTNPLTSISVNQKYTGYYFVDDTITNDDIEVIAHYSDGTTALVTTWTTDEDFSVAETDKTITISYTENTITQTTTITITIVKGYTFSTDVKILTGYNGTAGDTASYVEFGDWPQTIKASNVRIFEQKKLETGLFTYYAGSDGNWYVKQAEYSSNPDYVYKYSNGSYVGHDGLSYRYFKVEPIKWRVLEEKDGKKFLLAENGLMAMSYFDVYYYRTIGTETIYANNYKHSKIRAWLNGYNYPNCDANNGDTYDCADYQNKGFLQTAFTSVAQSKIAITTVDNSVKSTGVSSNPCVCEDTDDKVFLLSRKEATTATYGFSTEAENDARIRKPIDFALATGAVINQTSSGGAWWLRSPRYEYYHSPDTTTVFTVDPWGKVYRNEVSAEYYSVVPALWVTE